ncbi:MAG: MopE-related protein, partial [Myxococcota bacterium]
RDYHVSETELPPPRKQDLSSESHDIGAVHTGRVTDNDSRLRVTMDATFKYGTDWDDDGEDLDGLMGGTDCDDDDSNIHEAAMEIIGDGVDQDCDTEEICYVDADDDDYRLSTTVVSTDSDCDDSGEALSTINTGDCDDTDFNIKPGVSEIAGDEVDQNCDTEELCYVDSDGDFYRTDSTVVSTNLSCADAGEATASIPNNDCDDTDNAINPGVSEIPGDEIDQNCDLDEDCFVDADDDGFRLTTTVISTGDLSCEDPGEALATDTIGDCNDNDPAVNDDATEIAGDGVDQNCDAMELCYVDVDDDDFHADITAISSNLACDGAEEADDSIPGGDCNDADNTIYPGADEIIGDEVDQNCDATEICFSDLDGDGYRTDVELPSLDIACDELGEARFDLPDGDCNDLAGVGSTIYPDAPEVVADGIDQNCDGGDACYTDFDNDTFSTGEPNRSDDLDCDDPGESDVKPPDGEGDCDDTNDQIFPGAEEITADGVDQNCDGEEICYVDADQDGFRSFDEATAPSVDVDCNTIDGEALADAGIDCEGSDDNPEKYPGARGWTEDCEFDTTDDRPFVPTDPAAPSGCACSSSTSPTGVAWVFALGLVGLMRRRTRTS